MNDKKMIVVDLDGTLLNINQECSKKTKKYLKKLKSLGYIIVIATGRILKSAVDVTDGADFANYIICSSGALIYDIDNYKVIKKDDIFKEDMRRICSYYNEDIDYINMCDMFYYHRYMDDSGRDIFFDRKINDIDRFIDNSEDILHMIVKFKNNDLADKYSKLFKSDNLEILIMQDSFNDRKWIEIFSKDVSKYNAIKVIMELESISNDSVISFGDGLNDVDMIKLCGIGVAMGNALDDVKAVSDYVTISHNRDGVIYFLKKYIEENNLVS